MKGSGTRRKHTRTDKKESRAGPQSPAERITMKEYEVSYYLGDMYHCCIVEADNEAEAILKELRTLNDRSKEIMHDFKIERYYRPW